MPELSQRLAGTTLRSNIRRGCDIRHGLVITAVTWLFLPSVYIVFGILRFARAAITRAALCAVQPSVPHTRERRLHHSRLHHERVRRGPSSVGIRGVLRKLDYVPLLPWFGIVLAGMAFGGLLPGRAAKVCARTAGSRPGALVPRPALALHLLPAPASHTPLIAIVAPEAMPELW